jgi:holo-[acyl-carrier protein] synthase
VIIGIGSDLVDIRRVARVLDRHGDRFLRRCFTETERARSERRAGEIRVASYAKRWAAKEAAAKALGTGFAQGVFHGDLGVANLRSGQPTMVFTGGAASRLAALTPAGCEARVLLTMTDEPPYAFAAVIIEAVPRGS